MTEAVSGVTGIGGLPPMSVGEMELILADEAAIGSTPLVPSPPAAYLDLSPSAQSIAFTADEKAQMEALQTTELEVASTMPGQGPSPAAEPIYQLSTDLHA